jgi:esterase/lipase
MVILLVLAVLSLLAGCATPSPRLQASGLNSAFTTPPETPFAAYVAQTREMVLKARVDIHDGNRETVLRANLPFELRPDRGTFPPDERGRYRRGVLLVHGLSDSPYLLQPLARHLQERGFLVRTVLLPGHGTVPGDLLHVRWEEWQKAVDYGIRGLKAEVAELYLGGFSTGAALSVLAALRDREIRGLILLSPALAVKDRRAALAETLRNVTDWVGPIQDDADYAKYETFAVNAAYQIYGLTRTIEARLEEGQRIETPLFAALSAEDVTIDAQRALEIFRLWAPSPRNILLLYARHPDAETPWTSGRLYREESHLPDRKILDFSHVALPLPCDDPHYGLQGGYKSCLHYGQDREKRRICHGDGPIWLGEISPENLAVHTLRRLTCNPLYDRMLEHLDRFLDDLSPKQGPQKP